MYVTVLPREIFLISFIKPGQINTDHSAASFMLRYTHISNTYLALRGRGVTTVKIASCYRTRPQSAL